MVPGQPYRSDSRFVPSQWETALLCNDVSHWLGAKLESAQATISILQNWYQLCNTRGFGKNKMMPIYTKAQHFCIFRWMYFEYALKPCQISQKLSVYGFLILLRIVNDTVESLVNRGVIGLEDLIPLWRSGSFLDKYFIVFIHCSFE